MKILILACGIPAVALIWAIGASYATLEAILSYFEHHRSPRNVAAPVATGGRSAPEDPVAIAAPLHPIR